MTTANDQPVTLPGAALMLALAGASAVTGGAWALVAAILGKPSSIVLVGPIAAAAVTTCTVAGVLVLTPWKPRPVSMWINMWLAQTVARLFVTPVVAFLLYSAARLPTWPLIMAIGLIYLTAVTSEAGVLAMYLKRLRPA